MSHYAEFIENTLKTHYTDLDNLKDSDIVKIKLYEHTENKNKLVCIYSKNRNDHVFRAIRGYKHSSLPVIYEVCSCEEHLLVLESFVDGIALTDKIQSESIDTKQAVKYTIDICEALSFLHKKQIIHRDIKPENVIISDDTAILIDLQAARLVTDTENKDTINLGTIGYAAPEQYGIHQSTPPTDIYAVGVLLNELIVHCHPTIKTPSGKLGKIIKKCTETQIYNRYQSVDKLISDLKRAYKKL